MGPWETTDDSTVSQHCMSPEAWGHLPCLHLSVCRWKCAGWGARGPHRGHEGVGVVEKIKKGTQNCHDIWNTCKESTSGPPTYSNIWMSVSSKSRFSFFSFNYFLKTGPCNVAQAGLKLSIVLPQTPDCWDYRCTPPCLVSFQFLRKSTDIQLHGENNWSLVCPHPNPTKSNQICSKMVSFNFIVGSKTVSCFVLF
jgi:hypothetical protein